MTKKVVFNSATYLPVKMFGQEFLVREDFHKKLMLSIIFGKPNKISLLIRLSKELNKLNSNGNKPLVLKD